MCPLRSSYYVVIFKGRMYPHCILEDVLYSAAWWMCSVTAARLCPGVSPHSSPDLQNPHYSSLLIFLKQTLPRIYRVCDVNKRPLGTQMRMLSSLLLNKSIIWLTFLVIAYYKIQPVEISFHSTYLLVAKSSISHGKHLLCFASGLGAKSSQFY